MSQDPSYQVNSEQEYQQALTTLSQGKQPATILKLLMRGFEAYRAARKMGWSRPWNKYDLVNFQSLKLQPQQDGELLRLGRELLRHDLPQMPAEAREFVDELLSDGQLMGFIFCHEYRHEGRRWEGATLSLGRKNDRRYRDRLDIILESEVVEGRSAGLSRLRVYVDPYRGRPGPPLWQAEKEASSEQALMLFSQLSRASWEWPEEEGRLWDHWTSRYIDYFGARGFGLSHSYFHLPQQSQGRLQPETAPHSNVA